MNAIKKFSPNKQFDDNLSVTQNNLLALINWLELGNGHVIGAHLFIYERVVPLMSYVLTRWYCGQMLRIFFWSEST